MKKAGLVTRPCVCGVITTRMRLDGEDVNSPPSRQSKSESRACAPTLVALSLLVAAVERAVHTPFVVMLDQPVKSLLRCQALVNIDCDGRVADGQRRAVVCFFVGDADRHF